MALMHSARARLLALLTLFLGLLALSNFYLASLIEAEIAQTIAIAALCSGGLLFVLIVLSVVWPMNSVLGALRRTAAGDHSTALPTIRPDEFGEVTRALRQIRDYSAQLDRIAFTDPMTGLRNRASLERELAACLKRSNSQSQAIGLLFLDLDNFKSINDTLGHPIGDRYLMEAALRLRRLMPKGAELFHYSGDEFAVMWPGLATDEFLAMQTGLSIAPRLREKLEDFADSLLRGMSETYSVDGLHLVMSVSIGSAMYPRDGRDAEELITAAEAAMFEAKRAGRNQMMFSRREHKDSLLRQLELAGEIRRGLDAGEFQPYFQPVVHASTGQVVSAEALARWLHPQRGIVMPGEFIPIAEESGSIAPLGQHMFRRGCEELARLNGRANGMRLSINLSARQLRDADLVSKLGELLHVTNMPAQRIELEITESAILENSERNIRTLHALKRLGVGLAIDDFGTGYSSLAYLQRLPVSKLKIDRSFVMQLGESREAEAIIAATLAMSRSLGLDVVAEGVETRSQSQRLIDLGCEQQQGYFFTPALPADALGHWLSSSGHRPFLH